MSISITSDERHRIAANSRPAIMVITNTYSSYHHPIVEHLRTQLSPHGLGVLCITGRALEPNAQNDGCTAIYELATRLDVPGVIILAATLGRKVTESVVKHFVSHFAHLPMVTVGMETEHCSNVQADNAAPMRELVRHMTSDPKRKRFVFLRGFKGCSDSVEREQAFRDVMEERGLDVDESLVIRANYYASESYRAMDRLLDSRSDIDGVISADDGMASGALLALNFHGKHVPRDVILSGFEDSEHALSGAVPISTVRTSPLEHMQNAVELLFELINSKDDRAIKHIRVPAEIIYRESSQPIQIELPSEQGSLNESIPHSKQAGGNDAVRYFANTQYAEFLTGHEISERIHIGFARCTNIQSIYKVFTDAMIELGISRAFVLNFEIDSDSQLGHLRLACSFPKQDYVLKGSSFEAEKLLPDHMLSEFSLGTLVALGVKLEDELAGLLVFDPSGPGRASMDGLAQSLFSALQHCEQRDSLESQAKRLVASNKRLVLMANSDGLTGLANRLRFRDELEDAMTNELAKTVVLYLDLDGFKAVNDTFGHDAGDDVLVAMSSRIRACAGPHLVARLGGDEFSVLLTGAYDQLNVQKVVDQLLKEVSRPIHLAQNRTLTLSTSIGVACFPEHGIDAETLMKHADKAMYQAKFKGRNRSFWFNQALSREANEQARLDQAMRSGIDKGEFRLVYQSRIELSSGVVVGVEALLRWTKSDGTVVSPSEFMPVAEKTGFVSRLDAFAFNAACAQAASWLQQGIKCRVAMNLSVCRLQQSNVVEQVLKALSKHRVSSEMIELEITESARMSVVQSNIDKLEALSSMGIRLSAGNFGTEHSSLNYLKSLPVNCLKIDRSFLSPIQRSEDEISPDARIIRAIIALSQNLRVVVVAEGVENEFQRNFLAKLGCNEAQGFLFGRPLEASEMKQLLIESGRTFDPKLSSQKTAEHVFFAH